MWAAIKNPQTSQKVRVTHAVTMRNPAFCPDVNSTADLCVFFLIRIHKSSVISLTNISRIVLVMQRHFFFYEKETEFFKRNLETNVKFQKLKRNVGTFAKLKKTTIGVVMFACLSVRLSG